MSCKGGGLRNDRIGYVFLRYPPCPLVAIDLDHNADTPEDDLVLRPAPVVPGVTEQILKAAMKLRERLSGYVTSECMNAVPSSEEIATDRMTDDGCPNPPLLRRA